MSAHSTLRCPGVKRKVLKFKRKQQMSETIPVSAGEASAVLSQPGRGTGGDALAGAARS